MKELREAKKDQLRRQKADEIAAMRAALKAQAQQRAAKRGKRKDGRRATDPTKASRLNAHKRALVPEQASTVADDEEERPVTAEDPYRGLEPFRLNSAALRILDGERGSSDDEASIASEARNAADRLDETLAASPQREDDDVGFFDPTSSANLLVAGIGVGILTIPLVASISEDALQSVPVSLREAAYGVGAKKVQTVIRVVIPAALSGLVAAFIVAVSRAIGETLVVTIAAGGSGGAVFPEAFPSPEILTDAGLTMTAAMATVAAGSDQVVGQGPTFQSLFFVGLLLFILTFLLNFVADRIVRRFRQAY